MSRNRGIDTVGSGVDHWVRIGTNRQPGRSGAGFVPYCSRHYHAIRKIMEHTEFNNDLIEFLNASPTPWHAVSTMKSRLDAAGFQQLDEREEWALEQGKGYYAIRNGSSIIAFRTGTKGVATSGIRMVGAHTDSPCLKVKPSPEIRRKGFFQLGVEVYGGVLRSEEHT